MSPRLRRSWRRCQSCKAWQGQGPGRAAWRPCAMAATWRARCSATSSSRLMWLRRSRACRVSYRALSRVDAGLGPRQKRCTVAAMCGSEEHCSCVLHGRVVCNASGSSRLKAATVCTYIVGAVYIHLSAVYMSHGRSITHVLGAVYICCGRSGDFIHASGCTTSHDLQLTTACIFGASGMLAGG